MRMLQESFSTYEFIELSKKNKMEVHKKVVHIRLSLSCNTLVSYKERKPFW